jgi:hypothetical protein
MAPPMDIIKVFTLNNSQKGKPKKREKFKSSIIENWKQPSIQ